MKVPLLWKAHDTAASVKTYKDGTVVQMGTISVNCLSPLTSLEVSAASAFAFVYIKVHEVHAPSSFKDLFDKQFTHPFVSKFGVPRQQVVPKAGGPKTPRAE